MQNKKTILIVDDDEGNRTLLGAMLEIGGFTVLKAAEGTQCLSILKVYSVDAILLDVMMPGMNGLEVCQAIKSNPAVQHTPVIMVTALSDDGSRQKAFANGANGFLSKPVGFDTLIKQVESVTSLVVAA